MNAFGSTMAVDPRVHDRQAATSTDDACRCLCFALTLQCLTVFAWHYGVETPRRFVPLAEQAPGARTARIASVLFDEVPQRIALAEIGDGNQIDHGEVAMLLEQIELIEHERHSAAHTGGKVTTSFAEHDDSTAGHVLAAVIADAFDDSSRAAVAHGKTFTGGAGEIRFAPCRAGQDGIADQNSLIGDEMRRARVAHHASPTPKA